MTLNIARHHQSNAQASSLFTYRSEQRPALQLRASRIGAERDEVVEGPGVFDAHNAIRFEPDAEHVFIRGVLLCGFYPPSQLTIAKFFWLNRGQSLLRLFRHD